jgi:hypothetical protein
MASNARNLSKLLGTSTQVPTTALPPAIADLETVGQTLSGGEIAPSSIKSNTLTQSFDSNPAVTFNMADSIDAVSPIVSVFKEVPQQGFSSKGQWDVNANATNYDFYDEKPISYASTTLTPSATGDGTFTNSAAIVSGYDISLISSGYVRQINATTYGGATWTNAAEISSDGTKIYFSERSGDTIKVFSLLTAYDITTIAGTASSQYSLSADSWAIRVNSAGTKMWVVYDTSIEQFTLSAAHDVSTASSDGTWTLGTYLRDIRFNDDGTKIYIVDISPDDIFQYSLTTAYDITGTKTLDGTETVGPVNCSSILFNDDGSKLYYGQQNSSIYVKNLGTPYDITTNVSSGTTVAWDSSANAGNYEPVDMFFNANGTKLFILHAENASPYHKFLSEFTSGSTNAFNAADVGKKVVGNSGSAIITSTAGAYTSVTPFADTSTISSWQLFSSQGKSDGTGIQLSGFVSGYDISSPSNVKSWATPVSPAENISSAMLGSDGTKGFYLDPSNDQIVYITLSTAFDISTATRQGSFTTQSSDAARGLYIFGDGTRIYTTSPADYVRRYDLSTAWDISTVTYTNNFYQAAQEASMNGLEFKPDGTKMYVCGTQNNTAYQYSLSTAWDITTASYDSKSLSISDVGTSAMDLRFNSDGTKLFAMRNTGQILTYNLSTPWDISTGSYSSSETWVTGYTNVWGFSFANNGTKILISNYGADPDELVMYDTGGTDHPYSTYSPALTNSSNGQINSSSWLDINSMTADETKNGGDIFYAVSTDNRTSWGVAKGSDGVRKIARNNSGTWQYNNDAGTLEGFDYANATTTGDTLTVDVSNVGVAGGSNQGIIFSADGTKFYFVYQATSSNSRIYQVTLGTAWDLTSGTTKYTFNPSVTQISAGSIGFNQNGTALYIAWRAHPGTARYFKKFTLSTAWDLSTASGGVNSANLNSSGDFETCRGLTVGLNEEFIVTTDYAASDDHLAKFTFATAGDVTSSITKSESTNVTSYTNFPPVGLGNTQLSIAGPQFFDNGNKLFFMNYSYGGDAYIVNLTSAYDITSGTLGSTTGDISGAGTWMAYGVKPDGTRLYIFDHNSSSLIEYSTGNINYTTSETWVNGTNNNEHATLQQALGAQSFNRMDKAQLDAVADNYHFSQDSADTLDLMIAPYAASGTSPISDGVTINYDAAALIREAIPGTDYIADFPNPTTLNITAVGAANLKIRAQ